jgi:hypothetical protein
LSSDRLPEAGIIEALGIENGFVLNYDGCLFSLGLIPVLFNCPGVFDSLPCVENGFFPPDN